MFPFESVAEHDVEELHVMSVDGPGLPEALELQLDAPPAGLSETKVVPEISIAAQKVSDGHETAIMY
jgi:hypothetical protein